MVRTSLLLMLVLSVFLTVSGCALTGSSPPPVTHATSDAFQDCRGCHEKGTQGAPKTDHALKDDCLSCHPATPQE